MLAVGLAASLAACDSRVELLAQVTESQANEVLAVLLQQGVSAQKMPGKEGTVSLNVAESQVAKAIGIMHANGLPREPHARMGDVFKKEGLISSPLEERARMVYALSQELSGTIARIDGVIDAQVHVVLPERGGFGEQSNPSSAAVFIKHLDTVPMDNVVPQVRRLVANSIPGLAYERVSVVLVPSAPVEATVGEAGKPAELTSVLGIEVATASAMPLRVALAGLGIVVVLVIGAAVGMVLRLRRPSAKQA
jgi:type III secretion protein J